MNDMSISQFCIIIKVMQYFQNNYTFLIKPYIIIRWKLEINDILTIYLYLID